MSLANIVSERILLVILSFLSSPHFSLRNTVIKWKTSLALAAILVQLESRRGKINRRRQE
jgi:hypothetical protein